MRIVAELGLWEGCMAKERARRRAEREAQAEVERARRAREVQRRARSRARRERLRGLIPDRPRTAPGLLAKRRRRRLAALAGIIIVICAIAWPLIPDWGGRILLALGLVMLAPVAWVLSFGRV